MKMFVENRAQRVLAIVTGAALAVLLIGGCGDGGRDTATISEAAYVQGASAICKKSYARVKAEYDRFTADWAPEKQFTNQEARDYAADVLIPAKRQQIKEFVALGVPSGEEDAGEEFIDAYEEGLQRAEDDPARAVTSAFGVFGEANERAEALGVEDCRG